MWTKTFEIDINNLKGIAPIRIQNRESKGKFYQIFRGGKTLYTKLFLGIGTQMRSYPFVSWQSNFNTNAGGKNALEAKLQGNFAS